MVQISPATILLTNYDSVVISYKQFAVNVDEFSDEISIQLSICSKPTERYVVYPLISNWGLKGTMRWEWEVVIINAEARKSKTVNFQHLLNNNLM